jgi:hypothetical protein
METKLFVVTTNRGSFTVMARDTEHAVSIADVRIDREAQILQVVAAAGKALEEAYPWGYRSSDREP